MTTHLLVAATLAVALVVPTTVGAGPPTEQVRDYTDAIIRVLEDPALKTEARCPERLAAVRRLAAGALDISETARRALGVHWHRLKAAERQEFAVLFVDLLECSYISLIDRLRAERIRFVGESIEGDLAVVRAQITTRGTVEVPVDARLVRRGERWLVYDIAVEGISLVASYRTYFDKTIRSSSYEDLMQRFRKKLPEFLDLAREPS